MECCTLLTTIFYPTLQNHFFLANCHWRTRSIIHEWESKMFPTWGRHHIFVRPDLSGQSILSAGQGWTRGGVLVVLDSIFSKLWIVFDISWIPACSGTPLFTSPWSSPAGDTLVLSHSYRPCTNWVYHIPTDHAQTEYITYLQTKHKLSISHTYRSCTNWVYHIATEHAQTEYIT